MQIAVLGPIVVRVGGEPVDLGTRKQRALLAALILHRPQAVSIDTLIDLVWGDEAPPAAVSSLHGYVARLRRVLEPRRGARAPASVLVTTESGYALPVADADLDVTRFVTTAEAVHRRVTDVDRLVPTVPARITRAELADLAAQLDEALALWRGEPYAELGDHTTAVAERARLLDLHLTASEDRALIRSELGEHATAAAQLAALVPQHPLRERLWALWALTLARAGRQGDALAALRQVRDVLVEELGVDPGDALRAVEAAVLSQDARVLRPAARTPTAAARAEPADAIDERPIDDHDEDPQRWPLIDRDSELERLTALVGQAAGGRTRFAVVAGEPGIGKSRLIDELAGRARAEGFGVFVGRCSADDGAPPLWPWLGVLRELPEAMADLSDVDRQVLDELVLTAAPARPGIGAAGSPPTVESARFQIAEAVRRLLVAAAARRPVLLVLEDLHWADRSSLRLLHHLTESLVDVRVLVLVSRRARPEPSGVLADVSEALARRHALRLDLTGLSTDGVSRLVAAVTGQPATADVVTSLRARTDGNPFFLVELVRLLGDAPPDATERAPIPTAVSDVISARVARLPVPTQEVLQTAAVLGRGPGGRTGGDQRRGRGRGAGRRGHAVIHCGHRRRGRPPPSGRARRSDHHVARARRSRGAGDRCASAAFTLTARTATVTLSSGWPVAAWTFNGQVPGPALRVTQGDLVEVTLRNDNIAEGVTLHWHGYDVPNAEDGVPGLTQEGVLPGQQHVYRFIANQAGTYWYHTHEASDPAVRRGLYGTLVVDPREPDTVDGVDLTLPLHTLADVFVIGDRDVVTTHEVAPGTPVRLRVINTDSGPHRVALAGSPFRLAAVDGRDVHEPAEVAETAVRVPAGGRANLTLVMPDTPVALVVDGDGAGAGVRLVPPGQTAPSTVDGTARWPELDLTRYGTPAATPFDADTAYDRQFTMVLDRGVSLDGGPATPTPSTVGRIRAPRPRSSARATSSG